MCICHSDYVTSACKISIIAISYRLIFYFLDIIYVGDTKPCALFISETYFFRSFACVLDFLLVYNFSGLIPEARIILVSVIIVRVLKRAASGGVQFLHCAPLFLGCHLLFVRRLWRIVLINLLRDWFDLFDIIWFNLTENGALILEVRSVLTSSHQKWSSHRPIFTLITGGSEEKGGPRRRVPTLLLRGCQRAVRISQQYGVFYNGI